MQHSEYEKRYKQTVIDFFNNRGDYDNKMTIDRALPLLDFVNLQPKQKVIDVATGTGIVAIAAAEKVGSEGKVIGVDFSTGMLTLAKQKIQKLGLHNIELIEADAEYISFADSSFDAIICSTAIVSFQDIPAALRNWYRWLKPNGVVGFSCCSRESCEAPLIVKVCAEHGIDLENINERTGTVDRCHDLMKETGFEDIEIITKQLGFYRSLDRAKQWNGSWFHPRMNPLLNLTPEQMKNPIEDYAKEIAAKADDRGVWYENLTFFAIGRKTIDFRS
jgi:arsenite methyltransferase